MMDCIKTFEVLYNCYLHAFHIFIVCHFFVIFFGGCVQIHTSADIVFLIIILKIKSYFVPGPSIFNKLIVPHKIIIFLFCVDIVTLRSLVSLVLVTST